MNKDALSKLKLKIGYTIVYKRLYDYKTYAKYRNQWKLVCRKAIAEYETSISRDVEINPKVFFKYAFSKLNYSWYLF